MPGRLQRHFRALQERKAAGPHDPKNVKTQELAREDFENEVTAELQEVYIIVIITKGQDKRIGAVYFTREEADAAAEELSSKSSYADAYWELRHGELP